MKFTREQFDSLGTFHLDDLAIEDSQDVMFQVFNLLPNHLQGLGIAWGFQDTDFRNQVFVYLVREIYHMTVTEYYSTIYSDYRSGVFIPKTDLSLLKEG